MKTIRVKRIIKSIPDNWKNKNGVRVFFDHEEDIFEEFANRNSRPVKEYRQIIHEKVIPTVAGPTTDPNKFKYRIVPVTNQCPNMDNMDTEWLPRTAYCVRLPVNRIKSPYPIDLEIVIIVEAI